MTMPTSLKVAAEKGEGSFERRRRRTAGGFETSFSGLDLSEFSDNNINERHQPAASATLLQEKQAKARENERNDEEDARLQDLAWKRAERIKSEATKRQQLRSSWHNKLGTPPPTDGSSGPSDAKELMKAHTLATALVKMHGGDEHGAQSRKAGKRKARGKSSRPGLAGLRKVVGRPSSSARSGSSKNRMAATKVSKKTKHRL